jgi:pimeloyl-ACP methyl ester carboxylesterase
LTGRSVNESRVTMAYVTTSVGRVFYEERGAGFPVVMIHATLHDRRDYDQGLWRSFLDPEYDLRDRAAQIKAPTLVVWGEQDTILPPRAGRQSSAAIAGARLEMLDTGHVVFASDPGRFLALVEPFIADAERARLPVG